MRTSTLVLWILSTGTLAQTNAPEGSNEPSGPLQHLIEEVILPRKRVICQDCMARCKDPATYGRRFVTWNLEHQFPENHKPEDCAKICTDILHADLNNDVDVILRERAAGILNFEGGDRIWEFISPETEALVRTEIQYYQCSEDEYHRSGPKPPPTSGPKETIDRFWRNIFEQFLFLKKPPPDSPDSPNDSKKPPPKSKRPIAGGQRRVPSEYEIKLRACMQDVMRGQEKLRGLAQARCRTHILLSPWSVPSYPGVPAQPAPIPKVAPAPAVVP